MTRSTKTAATPIKAFAAALFLFFALATTAAAEHWIHVKVDGKNDERVTVNLPVSLLQSAAALIPAEASEEARVAIDDLEMDWNDLLAFWQEVKTAPEATFVTVETPDENVKVRKEGDYLLVRTTELSEDGANVDAQFPLAVVDALLSGPEGTLNFQAALEALAAHGPGNLVTVRDGDETVRVWIDDQNEAAD